MVVFGIFALLFSVLFIVPPLFHLNLKPNGLAPGFIPLRMINADLKFLIVTGCMAMVVGIVFVRMHILGNCKKTPKPSSFFRRYLSSERFCFHCYIAQPDACMGFLLAVAYCSLVFCILFIPVTVGANFDYIYFGASGCRRGCFLPCGTGPTLPMDGLEPSFGPHGICRDHLQP